MSVRPASRPATNCRDLPANGKAVMTGRVAHQLDELQKSILTGRELVELLATRLQSVLAPASISDGRVVADRDDPDSRKADAAAAPLTDAIAELDMLQRQANQVLESILSRLEVS